MKLLWIRVRCLLVPDGQHYVDVAMDDSGCVLKIAACDQREARSVQVLSDGPIETCNLTVELIKKGLDGSLNVHVQLCRMCRRWVLPFDRFVQSCPCCKLNTGGLGEDAPLWQLALKYAEATRDRRVLPEAARVSRGRSAAWLRDQHLASTS